LVANIAAAEQYAIHTAALATQPTTTTATPEAPQS